MTSLDRKIFVFDHILSWRTYKELGYLSEDYQKMGTPKIILDGIKDYGNLHCNVLSIKKGKISGWILSINAINYWFQKRDLSPSIATRMNLILRTKKDNSARSFFNPRGQIALNFGKFLGRQKIVLPYLALLLANLRLAKELGRAKPLQIIYITTGGTNANSDFLASWSERHASKLHVLYENWDGIFTKPVHFNKRLALYVWGDQGKIEAINIHGFDPSNVSRFGSPRINYLLENSQVTVKKSKYVFFAGGSTDWNSEMAYLFYTARKFMNKVYYLPHPKRYGKFLESKSKIASRGVLFPLDFIEKLNLGSELPPIELYSEIFSKTNCTISPLSTLALESALLGIPTIVLDEVIDLEQSHLKLSEAYGHLRDLKKFTNVRIVAEMDTFTKVLHEVNLQTSNNPATLQRMFQSSNSEFSDITKNLLECVRLTAQRD
jgi:hypothetical protein